MLQQSRSMGDDQGQVSGKQQIQQAQISGAWLN